MEREAFMRRHIIGFAIFSMIVGLTVIAYSFLKPFVIPEVPKSVPVEDERPYSCWTDRRTVSARVLTAEYDERSRELVADVELKWNGRGRPPEQLYYNVFLLNKGSGPEKWALNSDIALEPFDGPTRTIKRVRFSRKATEKFHDLDNIYAHIETAVDGKFISTQTERISSAKYLPVLKVHK